MRAHLSSWFGIGSVLWICASSAWCQGTETPYERSMKQQQLYDQQQQNARQQQQLEQQQRDQQWNESMRQSQAQQNAAAAQGRAVLQSWQKRPPLEPGKNPLLGRWNSQGNGASRGNGSGDMAALASALVGGLTAGMCDSMLGRGLVEFRPDALVAIGANGREQVRYHADYRGEGSRVVVLPREAVGFTHMIIDLSSPDRATVAAVGCNLARVGGSSSTAGVAESARTPAKWEFLARSADNGGMDAYVDKSTIRRSGKVVQMRDLWDFKSAHVFEGKSFLSVRNEYEYDCGGPRRRMLSTQGYSNHMGQGTIIASSDAPLRWEPIPSNSLFIEHWKTACARS